MCNVSLLFEEWDHLKEEISLSFKEKNKAKAGAGVEKGIELFIKSLYWTNDSDLFPLSTDKLEKLTYKPVNVEERISFVKTHPLLYHSLAVLTELMNEQIKIYHKKMIMKRASKP